ncbi:MAG: PA14 domain-containing protein, partial [Pseudomonadota bacterium]
PVTFELDISGDDAGATSYRLEGVPEGTEVQAGDLSAIADEAGTVDLSGWDLSLLSVTTPVEFVGDVEAQLVTTTQGSSGAIASTAVDLGFTVAQADLPPPSVDMGTGFRASYFDVDQRLSKLDQIDWSSDPTHEEVVSDINYRNSRESFWEGGDTDTFGARITGHVDVEEGGSFKFFLGGDDGVVLLINGEEVIDNDGLHGYRTRTGEIELEPGTHHIEVRYFENYGHAGLKLEWDGPGTDGRELVTSPELDDAQTVNGMPVTFELDISGDDAGATSYRLEGVPEGTEVQAGDLSAIADEAGTVDLSGWDLSLLSVTTPVEFVGDVEAQLVTTTQGTSGAIASTAVDLGFTVAQADLPPHSVDMGTGFRASYFDVDQRLSKLDQIDWSSDPTHEEVVSDINYRNSRESFWEGGDTDTFGARITGHVDVEEGGSFKFFLGGDDGVILLVNGEEVIDNDGLHGYRTRTGEIELEPGTHHIEVRYFENYGHAGLKLEWDGPGTDGRELVTGNSDLSVEENGMIAVKIDDTNLSDAAQVQISGLPPDTILISDDDVAVSDGGELDLTGWDLDLLEIAPPPGFEGEISGEITSTDIAFNGETVSGQSFFAIKVGEEVEPSSPDTGDGPSDMMAYSEQAGSEGSWVDAAESQGDKEQSNENAMDEPVIEQSDSTQYNDMNETYERSDW